MKNRISIFIIRCLDTKELSNKDIINQIFKDCNLTKPLSFINLILRFTDLYGSRIIFNKTHINKAFKDFYDDFPAFRKTKYEQ